MGLAPGLVWVAAIRMVTSPMVSSVPATWGVTGAQAVRLSRVGTTSTAHSSTEPRGEE